MTSRIVIEKSIITICLLLAIYITITCHCSDILLSCNKNIFYILVGIPLIYIIIINSFTFTTIHNLE